MDKKKLLNTGSMGYHATMRAVRERDKHTCQKCGRKWRKGREKQFDVHHLNDQEGKNKEFQVEHRMDEMITLCHPCHMNLPHVRKRMSEGKKKWHRERKKE